MSESTARLLAALELLQARRRVTGAELAARLQVDRRTARRYVARLIAMGVPIDSERGRDGAYRLTAGYKLPPMMFSDDEALALAMGLVAARDLGLGEARIAVESALAKLERVMPEALRVRVRSVSRAVRLDVRSPPAAARVDALSLLSEAIQKQQRVRLRYQAGEREGVAAAAPTERLFDAWGLALYLGHWYVVGHCHLRGGQRSFRLDRMLSVEPVPASFAAPPADFDALAALRQGVATLPRRHAVQIVLHATLDEARNCLAAELGVLEAVTTGEGRACVRLTTQVDDLAWFARELARLPFGIADCRPAALAAALRRHATRLLAALDAA
jgi:predicted DNA-binding transcriptional regulator YafY